MQGMWILRTANCLGIPSSQPALLPMHEINSQVSQLGLTACNLVTRTVPAEHLLQVGCNLIRNLPSSEVATLCLLRFEDCWAKRTGPSVRHDAQFFRGMAEAQLHFANPAVRSISIDARFGACSLVVYSQTRRRPGCREPIDADPRQNFVISPWIVIRPVVQLFVDPCQQAYRTICEAVAESLRLGALFQSIS